MRTNNIRKKRNTDKWQIDLETSNGLLKLGKIWLTLAYNLLRAKAFWPMSRVDFRTSLIGLTSKRYYLQKNGKRC